MCEAGWYECLCGLMIHLNTCDMLSPFITGASIIIECYNEQTITSKNMSSLAPYSLIKDELLKHVSVDVEAVWILAAVY